MFVSIFKLFGRYLKIDFNLLVYFYFINRNVHLKKNIYKYILFKNEGRIIINEAFTFFRCQN